MKILYICRLYSGFEESMRNAKWQPTGSPTIARMIERLDKDENYDPTFVFTCLDYNSGWTRTNDLKIMPEGLKRTISVLAGKNAIPPLGKLQEKLSYLRQLWQILKIYWRVKPDMIFCDRANIFAAAFFARFTKTPVLWRVMGILEIMRKAKDAKNARADYLRFLWSSPFSHVLCTMDGSGGNAWMEQCLDPAVDHTLMLNGFDFDMEADAKLKLEPPNDKIKVLFAGRMERLKGTKEFMHAIIETCKRTQDFHFVFAGGGSELGMMKKTAEKYGIADHVTFLGQLTPQQMRAARQHCDVYVSLNKMGNLTNTNLEAMADGLAIIIPVSDPETGIDKDTDALIPENVFYRFGCNGDTPALVKALLHFKDPAQRQAYQQATKEHARKVLKSWDQRIEDELAIYQDIVAKSKAG